MAMKKAWYYHIEYKAPEYKEVAYVVCVYNDGNARFWYPKEKSFSSVLKRAIKKNKFSRD